MSARERLAAMVRTERGDMTVWSTDMVDAAIDARDAEVEAKVRRQLLGDDCNPSNLVLEAQSYRLLRDAIEKTMADPDRWDGDTAEVDILARYVEWLAKRPSRADVLREATDQLALSLTPETPGAGPGFLLALRLTMRKLRTMTDAAEAGDGS